MNTHQTTPEASTMQTVWLLDATGQMLGHDTLQDRIIRQPFSPRTLPGLSLQLETPLPEKHSASPIRAHFQKQVSLPFPLPDVDVLPTMQDLVALRATGDEPNWVGLAEDRRNIIFNAPKMTATDYFLPLTKETFLGLAMLFNRSQIYVQTENGAPVGPAAFLPDMSFGLGLGNMAVPLAGNMSIIRQLTRLAPRESITWLFQEDRSLTIRRAD
ncbi:hypothetical protein NQF87_05445 [Bombella sp. TMW 2.2559]|uniref:Uncharacterized protein n=1 Tax=Bombella dulcis TaxID=2967339 RepID=A0ABT3WBF0_9PROT|nr:hypothetical protein [Bombella dulcis]MCX5616417.1 hypothetical protein [Bombella dulcis]